MSINLQPILKEPNPDIVLEYLEKYKNDFTYQHIKDLICLSKRNEVIIVELVKEIVYSVLKKSMVEKFEEFDEETICRLAQMLVAVNENIIKRIIEDFKIEDAQNRLRLIQILGMLGKNPDTEKFLIDVLSIKEEKIRATAIKVLGNIIDEGKIYILLDLLKDNDHRVRANVIEVIGDIGNPNMSGILLRFKTDDSNRVKANVVLSLWKIGYRDIDDYLIKLLSSKNEKVRASAAWVLGELTKLEKRFIQFFKYIKDDETPVVRKNFIKSVIQIGGTVVESYIKSIVNKDTLKELKMI